MLDLEWLRGVRLDMKPDFQGVKSFKHVQVPWISIVSTPSSISLLSFPPSSTVLS